MKLKILLIFFTFLVVSNSAFSQICSEFIQSQQNDIFHSSSKNLKDNLARAIASRPDIQTRFLGRNLNDLFNLNSDRLNELIGKVLLDGQKINQKPLFTKPEAMVYSVLGSESLLDQFQEKFGTKLISMKYLLNMNIALQGRYNITDSRQVMRKTSSQRILRLESDEQIANVLNNPYLRFFENADHMMIASSPMIDDLSPKLLARVAKIDPELSARISEYQAKKTQIGGNGPVDTELNQAMLHALLKERLKRFKHQSASAVSGKSPQDAKEILFQMSVDLTHDILSIQPFADQNTLTGHAVLSYLLTLLDLPPPRQTDLLNSTFGLSAEDRHSLVRRSVQATTYAIKDFTDRITNGYAIENSAGLYLTTMHDEITINIKKQGREKAVGTTSTEINPDQWLAYVKTRVQSDPKVKASLAKYPLVVLDSLLESFAELSTKINARFIHEKDGERAIGLKYAEADFIENFGVATSKDSLKWHEKIRRWFDQDANFIWRGHGYRDRAVTEEEILSMFTVPNSQFASNSALTAQYERRTNLKDASFNDLQSYNASIESGEIYKYADDQHKMGELYGRDSYGFSTSKAMSVAKAFAMGAMKVAKYGDQKDESAQSLIKTRINVMMLRANYYVDLGRLKPLNQEFSYTYGRQQEVMGIGVADPDSIMVVQLIGAEGQVEKSYVRNSQIPSQIWVIEGDYVPTEGLPELDKVAQVFDVWSGPVPKENVLRSPVVAPPPVATAPQTVDIKTTQATQTETKTPSLWNRLVKHVRSLF